MLNLILYFFFIQKAVGVVVNTSTKITFGSCIGFSYNDTSILKEIAKTNSEYFLLIGDAVYLDEWIYPYYNL